MHELGRQHEKNPKCTAKRFVSSQKSGMQKYFKMNKWNCESYGIYLTTKISFIESFFFFFIFFLAMPAPQLHSPRINIFIGLLIVSCLLPIVPSSRERNVAALNSEEILSKAELSPKPRRRKNN